MDKYELLGLLLQNLRDDHGPDEEDIDAAILRETTKIFELMVRHGHIARHMFDLTGIAPDDQLPELPRRYAQYKTTNYPITYVVFANQFVEWLTGEDDRDRLQLIDLIVMIKEFSWMEIEVTRRRRSYALMSVWVFPN